MSDKLHPQSSRYIEVDGVLYDVATGTASNSAHPKRQVISDIKPVKKSSPPTKPAGVQTNLFNQPISIHSDVLTTRAEHKEIKKRKKLRKSHKPKLSQNTLKSSASTQSYFSSVGLAFLWPLGGAACWQLAFIRSLLSPQTWFLALLPLLLLQLSLLGNSTLNQYLRNTKLAAQTFNYQQWIISFGVILTLFLVGILIRSLTTGTGLHLRLRKLDNKATNFSSAFRVAAHNSLKQSYNYLWHLFVILLISLGFTILALLVLKSNNQFVEVSQTRLVGAIIIIWLVSLSAMYAKHWIQISLISFNPNTVKIQRRSYQVLSTAPIQTITTAFISVSLVLTLFLYAYWIANVQLNYVVTTGAASFKISWYILATMSIFLLATLTGYLQQGLWARHTHWVLEKRPDIKRQLLSSSLDTKPTISPLLWCIYGIVIIVLIYALIAVYFSPQIRSTVSELQLQLPSSFSPLQ